MVASFCCVPGCYSNSLRNPEMSFYKFPKGGRLRTVWINGIRTHTKASSFQPEDFHRVCEVHFSEQQRTSENKVPTIFRVANPKTPSRYSFFGHKLRHNIGKQGTKTRKEDDSAQKDESIALNKSESDAVGSNIATDEPAPSAVSSELPQSEPGLSQMLRKLSVGNVNKFLENWTPESSTRETRKLARKVYNEAMNGDKDPVVRTRQKTKEYMASFQAKQSQNSHNEIHVSNAEAQSQARSEADAKAHLLARKCKPEVIPSRPKPRNRSHNENGFLIKAGKDVCDCFEEDCPGCHFPCPKCTSRKCGHECRVNRRWVYDVLEIEGKEGIIKNKYKD